VEIVRETASNSTEEELRVRRSMTAMEKTHACTMSTTVRTAERGSMLSAVMQLERGCGHRSAIFQCTYMLVGESRE
jgi:hypothetical protein